MLNALYYLIKGSIIYQILYGMSIVFLDGWWCDIEMGRIGLN